MEQLEPKPTSQTPQASAAQIPRLREPWSAGQMGQAAPQCCSGESHLEPLLMLLLYQAKVRPRWAMNRKCRWAARERSRLLEPPQDRLRAGRRLLALRQSHQYSPCHMHAPSLAQGNEKAQGLCLCPRSTLGQRCSALPLQGPSVRGQGARTWALEGQAERGAPSGSWVASCS